MSKEEYDRCLIEVKLKKIAHGVSGNAQPAPPTNPDEKRAAALSRTLDEQANTIEILARNYRLASIIVSSAGLTLNLPSTSPARRAAILAALQVVESEGLTSVNIEAVYQATQAGYKG